VREASVVVIVLYTWWLRLLAVPDGYISAGEFGFAEDCVPGYGFSVMVIEISVVLFVKGYGD